MNKLTEIKRGLSDYQHDEIDPADGELMRLGSIYRLPSDKYYADVTYLLSLLEEKDKALAEVDKNLDAAIEEINYSLNDNKSKEVKRVYADNAIRFIGYAYKALNTSSNNEGE